MAKASPSFQHYPSDWLVGTAHLDMECCGAYFQLLNYQWAKLGIPNDMDVLAGYCRMTPQRFAKVWEKIQDKFVESDGVLINERMESEREKVKQRRQNGKRGGRPRASDSL